MEVREAAACGISQREFIIGLYEEDLVPFYRLFQYSNDRNGYYDQDFLEDLKSQMLYIIGPSLEDETPNEASIGDVILQEGDGPFAYCLKFKESEAIKIYQILKSVDSPVKAFNKELNRRILDQLLEVAPGILQNIPLINR